MEIDDKLYKDFYTAIMCEAEKVIDWHKSKQKPSRTPAFMGLQAAYNIRRYAKDLGIIND